MDQELKDSLDEIKREIRQTRGQLHDEIQQTQEQLRSEIRQTQEQLRSEIRQTRALVDKRGDEIQQLRVQVDKQGDEIRQTRVLLEEQRGEIRLLAEGIIGSNQRLDSFKVDIAAQINELRSFITLPYKDLDVRVKVLEDWKECTKRDPLEIIHERYGGPKADKPG
jgi:chromosome segregation ATPase